MTAAVGVGAAVGVAVGAGVGVSADRSGGGPQAIDEAAAARETAPSITIRRNTVNIRGIVAHTGAGHRPAVVSDYMGVVDCTAVRW